MLYLNYITWDPSPGMFNFNLPLLNRPILWYGFLFAFGFFVGYLILTYLLRRYFLLKLQFRKEDVASWPDLIKTLGVQRCDSAKIIFTQLRQKDQQWCREWSIGREIPEEVKSAVIEALNALLIDRAIVFDRSLSPLCNRLLAFAIKKGADLSAIRKRLQIAEELSPMLLSIKAQTTKFAEQITFYVIIGAVIGSRLGDVLFYQNWHEIFRNPSSIIAVWQGGLASHGGAAGILIVLWIFAKCKRISFWTAVDFAVIPTAIAAVFIRLGNFFNQEILGTPTTLPWGIVFLHPADGGPIVPRHPAQLYEAVWYLCSFVILLAYWHRHPRFEPKGKVTGLFLVLVFGFRFLIEFLKIEQSAFMSVSSPLTMGQILSVPFILLGLWLFYRRPS